MNFVEVEEEEEGEEGEESPPIDPPRRSFSLVRTQRTLQIILGLFWLLDAGLQFQPYMFGSGFTTTYLLNNAQNQPDVIRWIITNVGNFVGPHVAVWNTFFALIQVAIGVGLLFQAHRPPGSAVSFFWAFGVWFFGEGLGLIFTGSASALTGAPGSVFMYGLIGMMAWPRLRTRDVRNSRSEWLPRRQARASEERPLRYWYGADIGRSPQFCSSFRTIGRRPRCPAPSLECPRVSRVPTPTSSIASATSSAVVAPGRRGSLQSAP